MVQTDLNGKTVLISGASRGIGLAIAKKLASEGANIVVLAKTTEANPKLPGTIYSAAEEIAEAGRSRGATALPLAVDIRDEHAVYDAVQKTVDRYGGIDILINNASAISLTSTSATPMKRYDLMNGVNTRGTYLCTQAALPWLRASGVQHRNPQVLMMSPPLSLKPKWFAPHVAYTIAKYGMSLCVLGMAEEFKSDGIAVNALWPRTVIDTAALQMIPGVDRAKCRKPEILADAASLIVQQEARIPANTGNFYIDEQLLSSAGVTDFDRYAVVPGTREFLLDLFLD